MPDESGGSDDATMSTRLGAEPDPALETAGAAEPLGNGSRGATPEVTPDGAEIEPEETPDGAEIEPEETPDGAEIEPEEDSDFSSDGQETAEEHDDLAEHVELVAKPKKKKKKKSGKKKEKADDFGVAVAGAAVTAPPPEAVAEQGRPESGRKGFAGFLSRNIVSLVLGLVVIGLAVALVLTLVQLRDDNALKGDRASALSSASTYATELASYNYADLDHDFGVVLGHSTTSFRRSFSQSSDALKSTLVKYHATATASVISAGIISATSSKVEALVVLVQTVSNSTEKHPTSDRSQVEITLVRSGGNWLIDQVTLL